MVLFAEYEISRQIELVESGGEVTNDTRSYDYDRGCVLLLIYIYK